MKNHPFTPGTLLLLLTMALAACSAETTAPTTAPTTASTAQPTSPSADLPPAAADPADPYPTRFPASKYDDLEIITLLPRDAIPAIDRPQFLSAETADQFYAPDELILGVTFDGEARAYSVPFLSSHEIVNDSIGSRNIAVTW